MNSTPNTRKRTNRSMVGISESAIIGKRPRVEPNQHHTPRQVVPPQQRRLLPQAVTPGGSPDSSPSNSSGGSGQLGPALRRRRYGVVQPIIDLVFMIQVLFPSIGNGYGKRDNKKLINYLQDRGVLAKEWTCPNHDTPAKLKKDDNWLDGYHWICPRCLNTKSVRNNSFYSQSVTLIYLFFYLS